MMRERKRISIAVYPLGDVTVASSRIRIYNVLPRLELSGYRVDFKAVGEYCDDYDLVIVQKRCDDFLFELGKPLILDMDDNYFEHGPDKERFIRIARHATAVVVSTEYLFTIASQYNSNVHLIPTGLDVQEIRQKSGNAQIGDVKKRAVWVGYPENLRYVAKLIPILREHSLTLRVITRNDPEVQQFVDENKDIIEFYAWDLATVDEHIAECDIGIAPMEEDSWSQAKSGYKVLKYLSLGLRVVCDASPEYARIEGELGEDIIASTPQEWAAKLVDERPLDQQRTSELLKKYSSAHLAAGWEIVIDTLQNVIEPRSQKLAGQHQQLNEQTLHLADTYRHTMLSLESYARRLVFALPTQSTNKSINPTLINKTIKTLMCTHNLNHEGAPYSQFEMTVGLKEKGVIEPVVFSPVDGPLRALYEARGIRVIIDSQLGSIIDFAGYRERVEIFAAFVKEQGVEVVYANTLINFHVIAAARYAGLPSIWNIRESEPWQYYQNWWGSELADEAIKCFEYPYKVVFVAHATMERYNAFESNSNFHVIHNGIDLDRISIEAGKYDRKAVREELGVSSDELVILLPGTICERKGQQDLARAMELLAPDCLKRIKCLIVGDSQLPMPYNNELHAIAEGLPTETKERLSILPTTAEVFKYYKAADIFVCTSKIESFPRVILEAMAFDLPIITTPVFGIREQVQEGVNALFYPPGDHEALAKSLERLIADNGMRGLFSENSAFVLSQLETFDEMIAGYATLFKEAWAFGLQEQTDKCRQLIIELHRLLSAVALQHTEQTRLLNEYHGQLAEFARELLECDQKIAAHDRMQLEQNQLLAESYDQLAQYTNQLAERSQQLHQKNLQLAEQDQQLHQKNLQLVEQNQQIVECEQQISDLLNSYSWKLTYPLRYMKDIVLKK